MLREIGLFPVLSRWHEHKTFLLPQKDTVFAADHFATTGT